MHEVAILSASCSSLVNCFPEDKVESVEPPRKNAREENRPISVLLNRYNSNSRKNGNTLELE